MDRLGSHRTWEWLGIGVWACLSTWLAGEILGQVDQPGAPLVVALAIVGSVFLSDLLSGTVHWAFDRYGQLDTPVLGPGFIRPFREHHDDPVGICGHDLVETNGNNCIACLLPLSLGLWLGPVEHLGLSTLMFGAAMGVFVTNQFHSWAHAPDPPRLARWLQRVGLALRPEHHKQHHSGAFDSHYCITNGWMNPALGWLQVFERIEAVLPPSVHVPESAATMTPHLTRGSHAPAANLPAEPTLRMQARGK